MPKKAKKTTAHSQKTFKAISGTLAYFGKKIGKDSGQPFFKVAIDLEDSIKFKGETTTRVDGIIYNQKIAAKLYGLTFHPTKGWIKTGTRAQTGALVTLNGEYKERINTHEGERFLNVEVIVRRIENLTVEILPDIPEDLLGYGAAEDAEEPLPV